MTTIVTTQEELDAAIEGGAEGIVIDSPPRVWLQVRGEAHVEAWGRSCVLASGHSHVEAWEYSHVDAWESSHVTAWDCTAVEAHGHSRVVAPPWVIVHRYSTKATVTGGTVIDMTFLDPSNPVAGATDDTEATPTRL